MPAWDPMQYARYSDQRSRPFFELLARVETEPARIVDLGCGDGPLTLALADRWPDARITGIDSSPDMLAAARRLDRGGRVTWVQGDLAQTDVGDADLIVSNAALHWVPNHAELLSGWARGLPRGGVLAFQVPGNFDAPSHRLLRDMLREHLGPDRAAELATNQPVLEPAGYLRLLRSAGLEADVWETTYLQVLPWAGGDPHPVLEWMRGTALRPVLGSLDPQASKEFLTEFERRLATAYPAGNGVVTYPFRRVFAVGARS